MQARNLISILLVAASASVAAATQFRAFDREAQVRGSDVILLGRVAALSSFRDASTGGIHTDVEIAVDEVWKGFPEADRVTVRTPGGIVDDIEQTVDGGATFHAGESVLLFLEDDGDAYRPWGMAFGKYSVEADRAGSFLVGSLPPKVSGAQRFEAVSVGLEDLHAEVEAILRGERR